MQVKLLRSAQVAEGTRAFWFEKPAGFSHKAGQYCYLTLPQVDGGPGAKRHLFSLASAPYEPELMIASRMRGTPYKEALLTMQPGDEAQLEGPKGGMILGPDTLRPVVFLTGGIGITPFLSMIRQATHEKDPRSIYLFYANRHKQDAAFFDELESLARINTNFTFVPIMTQMPQWEGEAGYIDEEMIGKYLDSAEEPHAEGQRTPVYYIAGPPRMVKSLRELLLKMKLEPGDIRTEEFAGYP